VSGAGGAAGEPFPASLDAKRVGELFYFLPAGRYASAFIRDCGTACVSHDAPQHHLPHNPRVTGQQFHPHPQSDFVFMSNNKRLWRCGQSAANLSRVTGGVGGAGEIWPNASPSMRSTARHGSQAFCNRCRFSANYVWDYAGISSISSSRADDLAMHPTVKPVALVADASAIARGAARSCSTVSAAPARL
jgi:hypothetical protein